MLSQCRPRAAPDDTATLYVLSPQKSGLSARGIRETGVGVISTDVALERAELPAASIAWRSADFTTRPEAVLASLVNVDGMFFGQIDQLVRRLRASLVPREPAGASATPAPEPDTPSTLAFAQACDLMRQGCRRAHNGIISMSSAYLRDLGHVAGRLRSGLGTTGSIGLAIISGEN
jgi:hypothetical protein